MKKAMKKASLISAMGLLGITATTGAFAQQEVGRVISSTPVIQQVAVPRQVCNQQPVAVQQPSSGGGAVVGAIVGGLLGNTIGHGTGRAVATGLGVVTGAAVGDNVERRGQPQYGYAQQCTTQNFYENRTVGYDVQYEYAGRQYKAQMPYDPGPTIRLQVAPASSGPMSAGQVSSGPADEAAPAVSQQPQAVILSEVPSAVYPSYANPYPAYSAYPGYYPAYPSYYPSFYYPPVSLSLGFGYIGGGGHHHRHWR